MQQHPEFHWRGNDTKAIQAIDELNWQRKEYLKQVEEILNAKPRSDATDRYVLKLYPFDDPGLSLKGAVDSDKNELSIGAIKESTATLFRKGLLLKIKDNGVEENYAFVPEARYRRAKCGELPERSE